LFQVGCKGNIAILVLYNIGHGSRDDGSLDSRSMGLGSVRIVQRSLSGLCLGVHLLLSGLLVLELIPPGLGCGLVG
jgi:hypothetical protein